jgi:hypothetical protein
MLHIQSAESAFFHKFGSHPSIIGEFHVCCSCRPEAADHPRCHHHAPGRLALRRLPGQRARRVRFERQLVPEGRRHPRLPRDPGGRDAHLQAPSQQGCQGEVHQPQPEQLGARQVPGRRLQVDPQVQDHRPPQLDGRGEVPHVRGLLQHRGHRRRRQAALPGWFTRSATQVLIGPVEPDTREGYVAHLRSHIPLGSTTFRYSGIGRFFLCHQNACG